MKLSNDLLNTLTAVVITAGSVTLTSCDSSLFGNEEEVIECGFEEECESPDTQHNWENCPGCGLG